jgi:hypothetical protein
VTDSFAGVFAGTKKIPRGSYVGIYSGELLTELEGEERGRYVWLARHRQLCSSELPSWLDTTTFLDAHIYFPSTFTI